VQSQQPEHPGTTNYYSVLLTLIFKKS